jgi:hypothetical protein
MTMSETITWDFSAAQARFTRELQQVIRNSRRGARHEVMENFKGMLRFCFAVTPPMGGKKTSTTRSGRNIRVDYAKGKRQGQKAIRKDLSRAFRMVPREWKRGNDWSLVYYFNQRFEPSFVRSFMEQPREQVLAWYKSKRNNKRRITGRPKFPMWESTVKWVYQQLLKEQGLTASGWLPAATRFNVAGIPRWISRHGAKVGGSVSINDTETAMQIIAINNTNHSDWMSIQQKLATAFTMQANAMARRTADFVNRQRIR